MEQLEEGSFAVGSHHRIALAVLGQVFHTDMKAVVGETWKIPIGFRSLVEP